MTWIKEGATRVKLRSAPRLLEGTVVVASGVVKGLGPSGLLAGMVLGVLGGLGPDGLLAGIIVDVLGTVTVAIQTVGQHQTGKDMHRQPSPTVTK